MFGDAESFGRVKQIYVTDTRRAQQTAAGLAQRLDLKPVVVEPKTIAGGARATACCARTAAGSRIVVGHSNTVPQMVAKLSDADQVPPMGDEEFDTMYVVTVPTIGKASVLRMKY